MCVSKRDSKISMLGFVLGALYLGLAGSAMAWITAPTDYPDVKIVGGEVSAGKAAFDPSNPNYLVTGGKCFVKSSKDGGKTWSAGVTLPQLPGATCNSNSAPPAVAYAADGSRLYAAYGYTRVAPDNWTQYGVEFSVSTDHGASWSTPLSIVENPESFIYSVIELAAAPDGPWVYMVIQLDAYFNAQVYFSSSRNWGSRWTPMKIIDAGDRGVETFSPSLAAGRKGNILIAYNREQSPGYGVSVARSSDHGGSFTYGNAASPIRADLYFYPDPEIKIGPYGTAHLVYQGPVGGSPAILYKSSVPPYTQWNTRQLRLDDAVPQESVKQPHLTIGECSDGSILHVTWVQSKNYTDDIKIMYTRRLGAPGNSWSDPLKISYFGYLKYGIVLNSIAAAGAKAFATFSSSSALFGSRVSSGVTCR